MDFVRFLAGPPSPRRNFPVAVARALQTNLLLALDPSRFDHWVTRVVDFRLPVMVRLALLGQVYPTTLSPSCLSGYHCRAAPAAPEMATRSALDHPVVVTCLALRRKPMVGGSHSSAMVSPSAVQARKFYPTGPTKIGRACL